MLVFDIAPSFSTPLPLEPMEYQLSPRYTHKKFEDPTLSDLIDVFEDSWIGFVFSPAEKLLSYPDGDVAAMTLITSYFEAFWIFQTGEDSDGKSKEFFINGFCQVFSSDSPGIDIAAKAIYKHIRCGFAHTGMLSHKVNFSRMGGKAFFLTYPKNSDGSLNMTAPVASIIVNPLKMYEGVSQHFRAYVAALRSGENHDLTCSFQLVVTKLWGLGKGDNIIGMLETEFVGRK